MTHRQRHNSPERLKQVALRPPFVLDAAWGDIAGGADTGGFF